MLNLKLYIQTVTATKVTDPRTTTRVETKGVATLSFFGSRMHVVLYYDKASDEDSGYFLAGWSKASLMRAIEEEPMLAGRVRRVGEIEGRFEIVSNDTGVRLVEARISKTLAEFVRMKERDKLEGDLVSWEDGGDETTQFCPLLHIQVTNFLCGGYSVGISCSLLIADPFSAISFLKRWADNHQKLVYETNNHKLPIFYLPNFKSQNSRVATKIGSNTFKDRGQTLIFKTSNIKTLNDSAMNKALALQCLEEAELKHCAERTSSFYLFVKELNGDVKVEKAEREWLMEKPLLELSCVNWDKLGANEVTFCEGNKVACISNWINSISGEGLVVLFPVSSESESVSEINIIVTLPEVTGV